MKVRIVAMQKLKYRQNDAISILEARLTFFLNNGIVKLWPVARTTVLAHASSAPEKWPLCSYEWVRPSLLPIDIHLLRCRPKSSRMIVQVDAFPTPFWRLDDFVHQANVWQYFGSLYPPLHSLGMQRPVDVFVDFLGRFEVEQSHLLRCVTSI